MALVLTAEQELLARSAGDFFADKAPVAHQRKLRDDHDALGFSREIWAACADLGFSGLLAAEDAGGLGLGAVEAGIVMEAIGRNLSPSPFLSSAVLGVAAFAQDAQAQRRIETTGKIARGEWLTAFCLDEGPKHRPERIACRAERAGNGFCLTGAKTFVLDGHVADRLIVVARTSGGDDEAAGVTLFVVDPKTPGVEIERTATVDSRNSARIRFAGVTVDADAALGEVDQGRLILDRMLAFGRAAVASELVGIGAEAFAHTLDHLKTRKQFGRFIGEFQALQHRAAHLFCEIEITRALVLKAQQSLDAAPEKAGPLVAAAKARAGATATLAVQEAVQMYGGMGMTDALDVGLFMKRARAAQEVFGDADHHSDRLARAMSY